jgi:hypothetical protein
MLSNNVTQYGGMRYPKGEEIIGDEEHRKLFRKYLEKYDGALLPFIKLNDIPEPLKYRTGIVKTIYQQMFRALIHNGQRKLFLTELQHLTHVLNSANEEALIIYAGSAPGNHSPTLGSMFPNCKFIFVDPNEFNMYVNKFHDSHYYYPESGRFVYMSISADNKHMYRLDEGVKKMVHFKDPKKVLTLDDVDTYKGWDNDEEFIDFILKSNYQYYLVEELFTPEIANLMNKLIKRVPERKVIFWSDIRSQFAGDTIEGESGAGDIDVIANMAMTYGWIERIIKDRKDNFWTMLKFRFLYKDQKIDWGHIEALVSQAKIIEASITGHDFKQEYLDTGELSFYDGDVYIQPWAGGMSTETRLWSTLDQLKAPLKKYSYGVYEDKLFCYNMLFRVMREFKNPLAGKIDGLDHCNDCAIEVDSWKRFYDKFYQTLSQREKEQRILRNIQFLENITGRKLLRFPHGHS